MDPDNRVIETMVNEKNTLIQAVKKVLKIANNILNDNIIISENDKMWLQSVSRDMEETVNMLVYYGLQSGKIPIQRNSSIRFEEMNCIQNFSINIIAKQPFEMKHFGKMVKEKLEKYLDVVGESYNENLSDNRNIFISHGQDNEMLHTVKEYINELGLNPIHIAEEPYSGTIPDKITYYLDRCVFAIVLFSPDDRLENGNKQARQNVIDEFGIIRDRKNKGEIKGFFILRRKETILPSNISSYVWEDFDGTNWKDMLLKTLRKSGILK